MYIIHPTQRQHYYNNIITVALHNTRNIVGAAMLFVWKFKNIVYKLRPTDCLVSSAKTLNSCCWLVSSPSVIISLYLQVCIRVTYTGIFLV